MKKLFLFLALLFPLTALASPPVEEVDIAIQYLQSISEVDREYTRFLSCYAIPTSIKTRVKFSDNENVQTLSLKQAAYFPMNFWIHSMSAGDSFARPTKISNTLYAIDIRNYYWTPEAWEKVSELDPYYREPWIPFEKASQMRLMSGNAIMRLDWFVRHTCEVTLQEDRGIAVFPYYELLYASKGIPKNNLEFRAAWGFDLKQAEDFKVTGGTIIETGDSEVALHNRQLTRSRTLTGYYWETSDVKNLINGRDYIENLDPTIRAKNVDAGEAIATNYLGLQTYMLFNGQGVRVEFADPAIARDGTDPKDVRVRTARSCVICHPRGINQASNALVDTLENGIKLKYYDVYKRNEANRFYIENDLNQLILDDQELYARAIRKCNNLEPEENARLFKELLQWYDQEVTLEQAALECGVEVEEFKKKVSISASARLLNLTKGVPIPRLIWDEPKGGAFAQAMLLIYNLQDVVQQNILHTIQATQLKMGQEVLAEIPPNTPLTIIEEKDSWYLVLYDNVKGWVYKPHLK